MEEVIGRILEIDEQAEAYRKKNASQRDSEMADLQAELDKMEKEFEAKFALEKENMQNEIMKKADAEVESIVKNRDETLKYMQSVYNNKAEALANNLFEELKEKMKEG